MFDKYKDVVSVDELCEMLQICKTKAYELMRTGQIKSKRIGSIYKIPKKYIIEYLELPTDVGKSEK